MTAKPRRVDNIVPVAAILSRRQLRDGSIGSGAVLLAAESVRAQSMPCATADLIGPLGAKSQGYCGVEPVAPAVSTALANTTGVRFAHLPFTPDRLLSDLVAAS